MRSVLWLLSVLLATVAARADQMYSLSDLGAGSVIAINNAGEVLLENGSNAPFLYMSGVETPLPQPSHGSFVATALNNVGVVAGYSNLSGNTYNLTTYSNGALQISSALSGYAPVAINDRGQIAGDTISTYKAFLYSGGSVSIAGPLPGSDAAFAVGLNNSGTLLANSRVVDTDRPFVFANGITTPVPTPSGEAFADAGAINNAGQVVAVAYPNAGSFLNGQLFLSTSSGTKLLGSVLHQQGEEDFGNAINGGGEIVGNTQTASGVFAWVYTPAEGFSLLNSDVSSAPGVSLFQALGVNDSGEIIANGTVGGSEHAFLLTPVAVPEPGDAMLVLAGAGLIGNAAMLRRRRH